MCVSNGEMCVCVYACVRASVRVCVCVGGCMWICVGVHGDVFHLMNEHNLLLPIHFLCQSILTWKTTGVTKLITSLKIQ